MEPNKKSNRPEFKVYTIINSYEEFPSNLKKQISFEMYKKIISKFLFIYLYEVLFMNKTYYFPLTGKIKLNKCGNWIRKDQSNYKVGQEGKLKKTNWSLGFFWFERSVFPTIFTKLKKMTGSTNVLPLLEKEYKSQYNIDDLKTAKELKKTHKLTSRNKEYEKY